MRAGFLDRRIAIQRKTTGYSPSGEPQETWGTVVERWSNLRPLAGTEINAAQQWIAREQAEFTIRWSQDVDTLSPLDRIVCPSGDDANPRSIYDIIAVHEVKRHDELRVVAARQVG